MCQLCCLIVSFIFDRFINASYILSFVRILYLRIPFFLFTFLSLFTPNIGRYRAKYRVSQRFHACQLRCLIVSFIFDRFINASYILSFVRILYLRIPFFLFLIHAEYWPISSKISSFARISREGYVSITLSHRFFHFRSLYQCFLHSFVRRTCFFRKLSLFTPNIGR